MDREINDCFENIINKIKYKQNFCLEAGAGSGKTHTLIETIKYVQKDDDKKIICITYTNNAKDEILRRLDFKEKIFVSTIHDFIWESIHNYQKELRKIVNQLINEKIIKYELSGELERKEKYEKSDLTLEIKYKNYEALNYGIISHDTLLEIFAKFLDNEMFCQIFFSTFDYLFIDEYQDAHIKIFYKLLDAANKVKTKNIDFVIGLFGDRWQNIFEQGIGTIDIEYNEMFRTITKKENYRSNQNIIKLNNMFRSDLQQVCMNDEVENGRIEFIYNISNDVFLKKYFESNDEYNSYKKLYLVHKEISKEVGFETIFCTYKSKYSRNASDVIKNADDRFLNYICYDVMPLIFNFKNNKFSPIIKSIEITNFTCKDLIKLEQLLENLISKMGEISIKFFLEELFTLGILKPTRYDILCKSYSDTDDNEFLNEIISINSLEYFNYYLQFSNNTQYQTMHGTKGNEFENVIININETTPWSMYNFSKYLRNEILKNTIKLRTQNILYVACTRAKKSLIINYIVDKDESKNEKIIYEMEKNIKNLWNDNIRFVIYK